MDRASVIASIISLIGITISGALAAYANVHKGSEETHVSEEAQRDKSVWSFVETLRAENTRLTGLLDTRDQQITQLRKDVAESQLAEQRARLENDRLRTSTAPGNADRSSKG